MKQYLTVPVLMFTSFAIAGCQSSAAHYRAHQDETSLFAVLHTQVKNGDSRTKVEQLLGPAVPLPNGIETYKKIYAKHPQEYPDGVHDNDEAVTYLGAGQGCTWGLQYRDNRLVNFNPDEWAKVPHLVIGADN